MFFNEEIISQNLDIGFGAEKRFGITEAKQVGDALKLYWKKFDIDQFVLDLNDRIEQTQTDGSMNGGHDKKNVKHNITLA